MKLILITLCVLLTGCLPDRSDMYITDRCLHRQVFQECMASLPEGPRATHYNDWAEVVSECESVATGQSHRKGSQVKLECGG